MIPKVIHYCWFSDEKQNRFIRHCIATWRKTMPDFAIRRWKMEDLMGLMNVPFVKGAVEARNWAYVSDYIRLYALHQEGGIYLDSDVKTYRDFTPFLSNRFFIGSELPFHDGNIHVEPAIMGSEPGHPLLDRAINHYNTTLYLDDEGRRASEIPIALTRIMQDFYGYKAENIEQDLPDGVKVYDQSVFGHKFGTKPGNYYAIHFYNGSWYSSNRGRIYHFCKRNDLMGLYVRIERMLQ